MARYIKANYKVARHLGLELTRNKVADGNYLLWQADILAFGSLTELSSIMDRIGGIALLPGEARQEQDGTAIRELPIATDPDFVIATTAEEVEDNQTEEVVEEIDTLEEDQAEEVYDNDETVEEV